MAVLARLVLYTVPRRQRDASNGGSDSSRVGKGCLVLSSLVNAFTNYRCVKGEHRQKTVQVMDVTWFLPGLPLFLPTSTCNSV
jgi:hypothetical protein